MIKLRLRGTVDELKKFNRYLYKLESKGEIEVLTNSELYADRGQSKYFRKYLDLSVNEMAKEDINLLQEENKQLKQQLAEKEKENKDLEDDHNKLIDQYNKQYNDLCKEIKFQSSARERLVEKVRELEEQLKNAIVPKFKLGDYLYSVEKSGSQILLAEGYITTITQLDDGSIWYHLSVKPHEFGVREDTCYKTMDEVHEVSQKLLREIDDEQNNRKS